MILNIVNVYGCAQQKTQCIEKLPTLKLKNNKASTKFCKDELHKQRKYLIIQERKIYDKMNENLLLHMQYLEDYELNYNIIKKLKIIQRKIVQIDTLLTQK